MSAMTAASGALPKLGILIGDDVIHRGGAGVFEKRNPTTGEPQGEVPLASAEDVERAVRVAKQAFPAWRDTPGEERREILLRVAARIRERVADFATIGVLEVGTPTAYAAGASLAAADWFSYYAGWADKLTGEIVPGENFGYTLHEPFGIVAAIVAWNAPMVLAGQKVAPALAAGNCVILKPPELAPFACFELGRLCLEEGLPPGVLQVLPGGAECGEALIRHRDVAKVSFTGGTTVGRRVASLAGENLKPCVMELGGKSANILFEDANLDEAVPLSVGLVTVYAGQGCALPTRLLVQDTVYGQVLERAQAVFEGMTVGDPADPAIGLGPVISEGHLSRVVGVIDDAVSSGTGRLITGGKRVGGDLANGYFVAPTIFADVPNVSRLAQEEIFGPVLSVIPFSTEAEALEIANQSIFGLAGYIQTNDLRRAIRVAKNLDGGFISVNSFPKVRPATPFGGFRESGFGKEGGLPGILEFCRIKNVTMER